MREYHIDARNIKNPIYPAPIQQGGSNPSGNVLDFSNYYMRKDGQPFFAICGEVHYSRIPCEFWEDEIQKIKLGGLNIIATYVFWNHHEEIEGCFDWEASKNLRRFLTLCHKHGMYVILRIGPFDHGECRNGGFPDWMFGRPFDVRSNDPEYLAYTRKLFHQISLQVSGLLFKDGGPVIGTQLENEYEHASAPWEMTTENSKEWVAPGAQGIQHMRALKEIAQQEGIVTPFYTATAWGGSCAPPEVVFPLWGGYAFRPWMFYGDLEEHPATAEYLMNDFHNNASPQYYNFDPEYPKEDLPFACCEMGGGMTVFYQYRFQLPYDSVAAMAAVKVASGCNFLGYYMYHGGTNPKGKLTPFLNENAVPKFSYDYQACLGEFGQMRESYRQLKMQHQFYAAFQNELCAAKTVLPKEAENQKPEETDTLRYALRVDEQGRGFVFLNNYQDHADTHDQKEFVIQAQLDSGALRLPAAGTLDLKKDACAILPFRLQLGSVELEYASVQPVTKTTHHGMTYYLFSEVPGMRGEYAFKGENGTEIRKMEGAQYLADSDMTLLPATVGHCVTIVRGKETIVLCTLSSEDAKNLWVLDSPVASGLMICSAAPLVRDGKICFEHWNPTERLILKTFPGLNQDLLHRGWEKLGAEAMWECYEYTIPLPDKAFVWEDRSSRNEDASELKRPVVGSPITSTKVVNARAVLHFTEESFAGVKHLMLKVSYTGDIGYAFINGQMFHDNFYNGADWEIDLMPHKQALLTHGMYLYISPLKKGVKVNSTSAMAARFEEVDEQTAEIHGITLSPVFDV